MASTSKLFTEGPLARTEGRLDVAIDGHGFFKVLLPGGGVGYTRNGSFHLDSSGQLLTGAGAIIPL